MSIPDVEVRLLSLLVVGLINDAEGDAEEVVEEAKAEEAAKQDEN